MVEIMAALVICGAGSLSVGIGAMSSMAILLCINGIVS